MGQNEGMNFDPKILISSVMIVICDHPSSLALLDLCVRSSLPPVYRNLKNTAFFATTPFNVFKN